MRACGAARCAATPSKRKSAAKKHVVEMTPWEQATRGREVLEAIPEGSRTKAITRKPWTRIAPSITTAPQSKYAAPAVYAVAELLAEQGSDLGDAKSLRAAVGQYEFLRTQYPGSSLRVGALLAEGQIYENGLHDATAARERYSLLLKQYPHSSQAEEAKAGLASLDSPRPSPQRAAKDTAITPRATSDGPVAQTSRSVGQTSPASTPTPSGETSCSSAARDSRSDAG